MSEPAGRRRRRWTVLVVAAWVAVAAVVAVVAFRGDPSPEPPRPTIPAGAVEVDSDAPAHADLAGLVAAADLVVRGTVAATERGRWFGGDAGSPRVQSRIVTVEVTEVLAGEAPAAPSILVEEVGWLDDGTPAVVDGAFPATVGEDGYWFLEQGGDPELGAYLVTGPQGRYVLVGDELVGTEGDDPLVGRIEALGPDRFATEVRAAARAPG